MNLNRPDYLLRPAAVTRRIRTSYASPGQGEQRTVTPAWGLPLLARTDESIGYGLIVTGVFDLAVTETLLRLADPGELALDVGANIGCMTSALTAAVGPQGEVWAFEPSPAVLPTLRQATAAWNRSVRVFDVALSDTKGSAEFVVPVVAANGGMARLGSDAGPGDELASVATERLDDLLDGRRVGVLKIDAERHEPEVLAGAADLIADRRVRDVVYEDVTGFPSDTSAPLTEAGYEVFALGHSFFGPRLDPPTRVTAGEEEQSYLATTDPDRARQRLAGRGWRCLGQSVRARRG